MNRHYIALYSREWPHLGLTDNDQNLTLAFIALVSIGQQGKVQMYKQLILDIILYNNFVVGASLQKRSNLSN